MALIVPAILEDTIDACNSKIAAFLRFPEIKRIQIDISDGKFTPRKTFALTELDLLNPTVAWEAHLMVENPGEYFFDAKLAGFSTVIFHFEAVSDKSKLQSLADEVRKLKMSPALAIRPDTAADSALDYLQYFDQILVLGVHPGYQGQDIDQSTFEKLKILRNGSKNVIIEVDGGVKLSNLKELQQAGAEYFVVGSALFDPLSPERTPQQNFELLSQELAA